MLSTLWSRQLTMQWVARLHLAVAHSQDGLSTSSLQSLLRMSSERRRSRSLHSSFPWSTSTGQSLTCRSPSSSGPVNGFSSELSYLPIRCVHFLSFYKSYRWLFPSQYLNDSTLKNIHWALCTGVFGKRDIGRIEREFLDVLDFQLGITEDDILAHHGAIISITRPHLRVTVTEAPSVRSPLQYDSTNRLAHNASPKSHWSSDSSDMDSLSSLESGSPPHTPAHPAMDVDTASYVPAPSKHTPEYLNVSSVRSPPKPAKESSHRRLSSAFQLLRSFPLPQFHHSRPNSSATTPSSTLPSSTSSSATSLSIPSTGCKPIAPVQVIPRVASLVWNNVAWTLLLLLFVRSSLHIKSSFLNSSIIFIL